MDAAPLILASASPRRRSLLLQMGLTFEVLVSEADEAHDDRFSPHELCQLNAYRKARAVAKHHLDARVLGADTLVCLGHRIFGKPTDYLQAASMLRQLAGHTHQVVTGVCLLHLRTHRQRTFLESTEVTFRPLAEAQIQRYLELVNPLDKAGAYAIQESGELIIERIEGSFANVVGLPVERLAVELAAFP